MEDISRREFFKKFIPKSKEPSESISLPETTDEVPENQPTLSRRSFIKFLCAMGAAVALEQVGISTAEAQERQKNKDTKVEKPGKSAQRSDIKNSPNDNKEPETKDKEKENSYTETMLAQSLLMVAKVLAVSIFKKLKIEHGNKTLSEKELIDYLKAKPIELIIEGGVLLPVVEEAIFRALPSSLIDNKNKSHRWDIGIPTSLIFALAHNIGVDEFEELEFKKSVPIAQFMGGLFYWYLMREKGYSHAVLAHSMNNIIPISIGALLFRIYPKGKAESIAKKMF